MHCRLPWVCDRRFKFRQAELGPDLKQPTGYYRLPHSTVGLPQQVGKDDFARVTT
jgi:hypothetical protein